MLQLQVRVTTAGQDWRVGAKTTSAFGREAGAGLRQRRGDSVVGVRAVRWRMSAPPVMSVASG